MSGELTPYQSGGLAPAGATNRQSFGETLVVLSWVGTVLTLGYLLPTAVAVQRGRANAGQILVINLLLGWTLVFWLLCLVWAMAAHEPVGPPVPTGSVAAPAGWYAQPDGSLRYWTGTLWVQKL